MDASLKIVYDSIVKRHMGTNSVHTKRLIFYLLDLTLLIVNIVMHCLNGAYVGLVLTIAIHIVSSSVLTFMYSANESEIDEGNTTFDKNKRAWGIFRAVCKWLLLAPLFRIIVNWKDHGKMHSLIRMQQKMRNSIEGEEVHAAVLIRKRLLVNAYFDAIHAYCKTIPHCLLQIFMALDLHLPLRFCGLTDVTRFVTMIGSIIMAARASASYSTEVSDYLTLMQIQDKLKYRRSIEALQGPASHHWWVAFLVSGIVILSRVYSIGFIMKSSTELLIVPICLLVIILILNLLWIRINPESRPKYENPPRGVLTVYSEIMDRFMNIFSIHPTVPSFKTTLIHQTVFGIAFYVFSAGIQISLYGFSIQRNRIVHSPHILPCNFSTFSNSQNNLARALHLVLNEYGEQVPMFEELFSESRSVTLLVISFLSSLGYVLYLWTFNLRKQVFPFQVSVKHWKGFLDRKWEDLGTVVAAKTLLLGVLDLNYLESINYNLPDTISELRTLMRIVRSGIGSTGKGEAIPVDLNPCHFQLKVLKHYLSDIEESQFLCDYLTNDFHTCMDQMTSYRIAQTSNVLSKNLGSELLFRNYKYFGIKFQNGGEINDIST